MTAITTAITLTNAIALLSTFKNEKVTMVHRRAIVLKGGMANPMQGKVFKEVKSTNYMGEQHSYYAKMERAGKQIATHESIEQDAELEHLKKEVRGLWQNKAGVGMGVHLGGAIGEHRETKQKYLLYYPVKNCKSEISYSFDGKPIEISAIEGFAEKARAGAKVELTDGMEYESDVKMTTLKIEHLKQFEYGGTTYMIVENIQI